jgi:hypothetical protein
MIFLKVHIKKESFSALEIIVKKILLVICPYSDVSEDNIGLISTDMGENS